MEEKKTQIGSVSRIFNETKEHTLEQELTLPDYYPEIGRVISCSVYPETEDVTLSTDKLSVSGRAQILLVYAGEENETVSYEQQIRYSKIIACSETKDGDHAEAAQSIASVRSRATGPRTMEIRAVIALRCEIFRRDAREVIEAFPEDDVAVSYTEASIFQPEALSSATAELTKPVTLPVPKDRISCILCRSARPVVQDVSAVTNKVMLNGSVTVAFDVISKDGVTYRALRYTFPFSEICDVYGARENAEIYHEIRGCSLRIDTDTASDDERAAEAVVCFQILLFLGTRREIRFAKDAFLLRRPSETGFTALSLQSPPQYVMHSESASFTLDLRESDARPVCASLENLVLVSEEQNTLRCSGDALLYYEDGDKKLRSVCKKTTFTLNSPDQYFEGIRFIHMETGDVAAEIEGRTARLTADLRIVGFSAPCTYQNAVLNVSSGEDGAECEQKLTLYYARKGESVWEIAKKYRTLPAGIRRDPTAESDLLQTDELLVFYA